MSRLIVFHLLFLATNIAFGQFRVRLIDNHSSKTIVPDSTLFIFSSNYTIDSKTNEIVVSKLRGPYLHISINDYENQSEKINKKQYRDKVLPFRLNPSSRLINERFNDLWVLKSKSADTLRIDTMTEVKTELMYFINQLSIHRDCSESMCNYNRTFQYSITVEKQQGLYVITSIKNDKNLQTCKELQVQLSDFSKVFPKIECKECSETNYVFSFALFLGN